MSQRFIMLVSLHTEQISPNLSCGGESHLTTGLPGRCKYIMISIKIDEHKYKRCSMESNAVCPCDKIFFFFLYLLLLLIIQKAQRKNISCGFKCFLYFKMISVALLPAGGTLTFFTFIYIYVEFLHLYTYNI